MFPNIAFHIEVTPLADGTYDLTQDPDGVFSKAQVNAVNITEAPNSDSEEPQPTDSLDTSTGKAPVHNPIISNYATYCYLLVHLSYWS